MQSQHITAIGSKNPCKVSSVTSVIKNYKSLQNTTIHSVTVDSGVSEQPMGIEEIQQGAKNRAKAAFDSVVQAHKQCNLSFGIESGIFQTKENRYYDITAVSVFEGSRHNIGWSCAFEIPQIIMKFVLEGKDLAQAANAAKIAHNPNLGKESGLIGIMTNGRLLRKDYTIQAITMALIQSEFPQYY